MTLQELNELYVFIAGVCLVIVWAIRGEAKSNQNAKDIARVEMEASRNQSRLESEIREIRAQIAALDSKLVDRLRSVERSLSRILGALNVKDLEDDR